jgi:lysozyme
MRRAAGVVVAAGIVALAGAALAPILYRHGLVRFSFPDRDQYPVRGIDVSHHQKAIDWRKVATDDVAFVYVKASEGGDYRDETFAANAAGAAAAGLPVGAYHFFTLCRAGAVQAANFLAATRAAALRLPAAVDVEFGGNCGRRPSRAEFEHELGVFLDTVGRASGRAPILYATHPFQRAYLRGGALETRPLWLRNVVGGLRTPPGSRLVLWQYAGNGRIDGVEGDVDLNVATASAFQSLVTAPASGE